MIWSFHANSIVGILLIVQVSTNVFLIFVYFSFHYSIVEWLCESFIYACKGIYKNWNLIQGIHNYTWSITITILSQMYILYVLVSVYFYPYKPFLIVMFFWYVHIFLYCRVSIPHFDFVRLMMSFKFKFPNVEPTWHVYSLSSILRIKLSS